MEISHLAHTEVQMKLMPSNFLKLEGSVSKMLEKNVCIGLDKLLKKKQTKLSFVTPVITLIIFFRCAC